MIHYPTLNFGLGETVDMLREAVREFASAEIAPRAGVPGRGTAEELLRACAAQDVEPIA